MLTTNFETQNNLGLETEEEIAQWLTENNVSFTRVDAKLPNGKHNPEQHKGDFRLNKSGVYLEVKNDNFAKRSGNIYFEIGELYTSDYKYNNKAGSAEAVGFTQKALMGEVIFIHKLNEDDFLVYTAKQLYDYVVNNFAGLFEWKETNATDTYQKVKIGLLLKNFNQKLQEYAGSDFTRTLRRCSKSELKETIISVHAREKKLDIEMTVNPLIAVMAAKNEIDNYIKRYPRFTYKVRGYQINPETLESYLDY